MSAIDQLQAGDWVKGAAGTHWKILNPEDWDGTVQLAAPADDAELRMKTRQFAQRLTNGEFEQTTPPEADR